MPISPRHALTFYFFFSSSHPTCTQHQPKLQTALPNDQPAYRQVATTTTQATHKPRIPIPAMSRQFSSSIPLSTLPSSHARSTSAPKNHHPGPVSATSQSSTPPALSLLEVSTRAMLALKGIARANRQRESFVLLSHLFLTITSSLESLGHISDLVASVTRPSESLRALRHFIFAAT